MKLQRAFLLLLSLYFSGSVALSNRLYVSVSGAGSMNGSSWANAMPAASLQAAINASSSGDEVWVACGTYKPSYNGNRSTAFAMKNGVAIYGSFQGTESALSGRNISCGPCSILSGDIGSIGTATDNSYDVVRNNNVALNSSSILDGFSIRDGYDTRPATNDTSGLGGGMYNRGGNSSNQCNPTISNCTFTNNTAVFGAGMFNHGSYTSYTNPIITNCLFYANTATDGGAAIDNFGIGNFSSNTNSASPVISNCVFYANTAANTAGAIYNWGGNGGAASPQISNSTFVKNVATSGNAGAIIADNANTSSGSSGSSNPVLVNCIVWGNTAGAVGNQFFCKGTGTLVASYSDIDLTGQTSPHVISGSGTGNIQSNPNFIAINDADGADNCWLTSDDGLQLQSNSPCIDLGNNSAAASVDVTNNNRIYNSTVDMGAYEFGSSPLAIDDWRFRLAKKEKGHELTWSSIQEQGTLEVQRSLNEADFETIAVLNGSLTTAFVDEYPAQGWNYYRLKGQNGDYSKVLALEKEGEASVGTYPNPATKILWIQGYAANTQMKVYTASGALFKSLSISSSQHQEEVSTWPSGLYFLVDFETGKSQKIIKTVD